MIAAIAGHVPIVSDDGNELEVGLQLAPNKSVIIVFLRAGHILRMVSAALHLKP